MIQGKAEKLYLGNITTLDLIKTDCTQSMFED